MPKNIEDQKRELITSLVSARRCVLEASMVVPAERLDENFLGSWSLKDLLAHLVGWDFTNLRAVQEILAGQVPTFFQYYDKDWHSYNATLVAQYKREPFSELLAELEDSHLHLVSYLESCSADEVVKGKARNPKGRTVTIRNLLRVEASDECKHAEQVQGFFAPGRAGGQSQPGSQED